MVSATSACRLKSVRGVQFHSEVKTNDADTAANKRCDRNSRENSDCLSKTIWTANFQPRPENGCSFAMRQIELFFVTEVNVLCIGTELLMQWADVDIRSRKLIMIDAKFRFRFRGGYLNVSGVCGQRPFVARLVEETSMIDWRLTVFYAIVMGVLSFFLLGVRNSWLDGIPPVCRMDESGFHYDQWIWLLSQEIRWLVAPPVGVRW